jgi:hypothetical protein
MKNLYKFYSKVDLPWVKLIWTKYYNNDKLSDQVMKGSFWWRSLLKLVHTYKGIAHASLESGWAILFWSDMWNGQILKLSYPHLHSYAKMIKSQQGMH